MHKHVSDTEGAQNFEHLSCDSYHKLIVPMPVPCGNHTDTQ